MVKFTLSYTPKGKPTFFKVGQIIQAGTMVLKDDKEFVTLESDYVVKGRSTVPITIDERIETLQLNKQNKAALIAVPC